MNHLIKLLLLCMICVGCSYEKDREYVKDSRGNIYMLKMGLRGEEYSLEPINKEQVKHLMNDTLK